MSFGKWVHAWLLALIVLGAALLLLAESVQSHEDAQSLVAIAQADSDLPHAVEGHLDHCHGGSFCSGLAVIATAPASPGLYLAASRVGVSPHDFRVLGPLGFDPPPPRSQS